MKVVYDRLLATPEPKRSALIEHYFEMLLKNGVSGDLMDQVRINFSAQLQISHTALSQAKDNDREICEEDGVLITTDSNEGLGGVKRHHTGEFFMERHVSILAEILAPYSSKWPEIGTALNLPRNFIQNLVAAMHFRSAEMCLESVLWEWVSGKCEHAKSPTKQNLKIALSSNMVKLGDVATDLDQTLCDHNVELEDEESAKRPCLDTEVPFSKENSSLACAPYAHGPIPIYNTHATEGLDRAYNIGSEISAYRKRADITSMHSEAVGSTIGSSDSSWLSKCRNILTNVYLAQPEVPEDSWPPVGNEVYINLALIKINSNISDSEYSRFTIRGDMDDIMKDKESIDYDSVFKNLISGARLLIEGRPGSGKTTLVHKVSRDWAKNELQWKNIELLFLVHLRHFFSDPEIGIPDLIKYHYTRKPSVDQIEEYAEQRNGEGLCFILDGLDEYTPPKSKLMTSTIFKLIRKEILPKAVVIVASRPSGSAKIRNVATKQVETLGFLKREIEQYVDEYKFSYPEKKDGLHSYLKDHPNVMHMCYLPIHSAMVCYLYDKLGSSLPRTETEMYTKFTNHTLLRLLHRTESEDTDIYLKSVNDLPEREKQLFDEISELAFEKTKLSEQVMKRSEIKHICGSVNSDKDSLGLITVDRVARIDGEESLYTFLHLTFQEYLAAYRISQLKEEDQFSLIQKYGKKKNMQVVWKFYCGLVDFEGKTAKFIELMKHSNDDQYKVHCAFESQQPITCSCLVQSEVHSLSFNGKFLNPTDFTAVGYIVSNATCPVEELVFNKCKFGEEGVGALSKEAGEKIHSIKRVCFHGGSTCGQHQFEVISLLLHTIASSIEILDVAGTSLGVKKSKVLADLSLPSLHTLKLDDNQCDIKLLKMFSTMLAHNSKCGCIHTPSLMIDRSVQKNVIATFGLEILMNSICKFPHINLSGYELKYNDTARLSNSILSHSWYTKLILTDCNLGNAEAKVLGITLKKLNTLVLKFNHIGDDGAKDLAQKLCHCSTLKLLDVSCNEIGDEGTIAIVNATSHFQNFKCLLWNHNISVYGADVLRNKKVEFSTTDHSLTYSGVIVMNDDILVLVSRMKEFPHHYSNLQALEFKITESVLKSVPICLEACTNLQILNLDGSKIYCKGAKILAEVLAEGLKRCYKLQTLNLNSNSVTSEGITAVIKGLKHCSKLLALILEDNCINSEGTQALAEGLVSLTNIQEFNLSNNLIGNDGVKALIKGLNSCSNLHTLLLDRNGIGSDGTKALAESLKHWKNLHTLNLNGNKIRGDGAKALAEGLKHLSDLYTLHLNGNGIGGDGAKALAEGLKHLSDLHALHLNGNGIGGDGAKALAEGLKDLSDLHTLHLNGNGIGCDGAKAIAGLKHCSDLHTLHLNENRIGGDSAKALAEGLKHCRDLHTLHLDGNGIGCDGAKALAEGLKHCSDLHTLHLNENRIGGDSAKAFAEHCSNLHTLHLNENRIGSDGAKALAEGLKHCRNLHTLHLNENRIGGDGAKALAEGLKHCRNLHTLHLNENRIGGDGAKALAEGLKHCSNLHTLHLNGNGIGGDSAKALAEGLKHCSDLHTLHLNENGIGGDGAKALAEGLKHCSDLHTLHLNENGIGGDSAKALAEGLKHCRDLHTIHLDGNGIGCDGAKALAEGLKHCSDLHTLHLNENRIGGDSAKAFAEGLKHCSNLHTLRLNENRIGGDSAKALAEGLKHCSNLHTLHLNENRIGGDSAKALAEGLKHCSNLHTLHLNGNGIGGDSAKALAEGLKHCSDLHTLHLDGNGIGCDGAKALAEGLKHCSDLHTLHLDGNGIGCDGAKALAEGLKHRSDLHTLHLDGNRIGSDGAKALAEGLKHCSDLHTLHLNENRIGSDGAKALAEGLKHCSNLHTLHLNKNRIGCEGAKALAEGLKHCSDLHTLHLNENRIGSDGAKALAEGLKHCSNLHTLHLNENRIGCEGAKALAEGLKHCSDLHTLHLDGNGIGDDGAKALAEGLKHCSDLHTLHLDGNGIGDDGAKALAESLKHCSDLHTLHLHGNGIGGNGAKALAEGLKHCSDLHTLHLGSNEIGSDGAKALAKGLKHCSDLHTLYLGNNEIGSDGAKALAEGLKNCSDLHTLHLGWNEIGDDGAKALAEGLKHCKNLSYNN